ncbi:MAG: undecaprenyl-phosphate glucose phosphotransferase, partial [Lachnospiraceae bacterium]|nr:undecaprenyl-phosphate glucose phosphotransferase [Lachnospiraceae bacterium]
MIRDNQKYFNRLHVIIDLLVVESSYLASWYLKFKTPIFEHESGRLSFDTYMRVSWFIVPLYMLLYLAFHLYTSKRVQGRRMEFGNILKANVLGLMIVLTVLYIMRQHYFSREMLFIFFVINMLMEVLVRSFIRFLLHMMRKSGFNKKHILLVGYSRAAESYIDRIKAFPQWGYEVKGILDDNVEIGTNYNGVKVIGKTDTLLELLAENDLDEIAITLGLNEYSKLAKLVNLCEKSGVHTQFVPDYNNIIPSRPYTEDLMGLPVINIRYVPLSNTFNALLKRVFD